jgi:hypothetical protein
VSKKPKQGSDDFRARPVAKNDDFRKKATSEDRFQSAVANERRKAKSTLDYANDEIQKIGMPDSRGVTMGGDSLMRGMAAVGSLMRQGVRKIQGKESLSDLKAKRNNAEAFMSDARKLQLSKPPGPDSFLTDRRIRDTKDAPAFKMKNGGKIDGCCIKGKTKGMMK